MKRTIILIFILLGITSLLTAQTTVSGPVSGDWYDTGNPYNVTGNLSVTNGTTLNIHEGVEIYFQGLYSFTINGTLNAVGTSTNKILFTVGGSATEFGSITFFSTASGYISYAIIEHGNKQGSNPHGGGILIDGCDPTISYTEIRECHATWGGGIFAIGDASPIIEWNDIHDNSADNLGGGIAMNGSGTNLVTIRNNEIYNNVSIGSGYGGGGISFYSGTTAEIYNNVVFHNTSGSSTHSGGVYAHNSGNTIEMWNNVIWGNTNAGTDPQINGSSTTTTTYCDVEGGFTGTGNINADPLFVSTASGNEDFHLQSSSPCINVGDLASSVPTGGGSCIDIGAFEYIASSQVTETGVDMSIADNEIEGASCAFAAQSGTVNVWAQQFLSDPPNSGGGNDVIGRYWELEASGNAYIRLFFNADEVTTISSPKIFQYIGSSWTEIGSSAVGTEGTSSYLDSSSPISNWGSRATSLFTVGEEDAPLPVNLSAFYALYIDGTPTLYWTTQSETENAYWNVYRGTNNSFTEAVHLNADDPVPGNGTTNSASDYVYIDNAPVVQNSTYWYWIEDVSFDGETVVHEPITLEIPFEDTPITPDTYGLHQNYPNPFNPSTSISFALEEDSDVELIIYNVKGAKIRTIFTDHVYANDITSVVWDGNDVDGKQVSSGVYFYKLITDTKEYQKKMLLVK